MTWKGIDHGQRKKEEHMIQSSFFALTGAKVHVYFSDKFFQLMNFSDSAKLLQDAAWSGDKDTVWFLLFTRSHIKTELKNSSGQTPLLLAITMGHNSIVEMLLERGASFNTQDYGKRTPLSVATQRRDKAIVKLLLNRHAETEKMNEDGLTPLLRACVNGDSAIAEMLLDRGAKTEAREIDPLDRLLAKACLLTAASGGKDAIVKL